MNATAKLTLAGIISTLKEVGISCTSDRSGPHGYIDLIVFSEDKFPNIIVAIQEFKERVTDTLEVGRLLATSVKTSDTFHSKGSDRQCIVEILALSEVLVTSNPDLEFVALLRPVKLCFAYICDRASEKGPSGHKLHLIINC